ncbi:thioredoxin domain-containing protein 11 isoform X2 [Aplysia californica]|uniref:Thioredoxin domain-containing protein 11 isoform X2 n=1 Tax=Aplysia californica TaxID=6500 RepID=A0ABM0ZWW9_APLCA|nr:thioredoxin domain-containing protein 11 isoform X2 [Aplysia californica]
MADVVKTHVVRTLAILRRPDALFRGMARHPEICCLLLTFFVTLVAKYGSSLQGKPVTMPPKQPQFMFPPTAMVADSPRGSLVPLIQLLSRDELVVVMYYAPWCSKSQRAREEFLKAANFLRSKVSFAAVNCWWPEGDCRKRYKFLMFPVVMVYHTKLDGYRYSGVMRSEHLIRFVENLLYPVTLVHSLPQSEEMVAKHENVVLGFFNLSSHSQENSYRQFYYAAMRTIERDPIQPVRFAVMTQAKLASGVNLFREEDIILLRLFNNSLVYPLRNNVTSSNLVTWALRNKGQLSVTRLSPEGLKSRVLADHLVQGPALILFHAENPLFEAERELHVLKTVALHFRQCMLRPRWSAMYSAWARVLRQDAVRYQQVAATCEKLRRTHAARGQASKCCISAIAQSLKRGNRVCSVCCHDDKVCSLLPTFQSTFANCSLPSDCQHVLLSYEWSHKCSICCRARADWTSQNPSRGHHRLADDGTKASFGFQESGFSHFSSHEGDPSSNRRPTDRYIRDHLERLPRRLCERLILEKQQSLVDHLTVQSGGFQLGTSGTFSGAKQFSEIGCSSNRSLSFYSIDSQNHWMFSDRLSVNISWPYQTSATVLFDKQNEEHYAMQENITISNAMSFILKFEKGQLERVRQSHSFPQTYCSAEGGRACIKELDAHSFTRAVHREDMDVVVLVYAHWCGFCQTFSHTFLSLAQYFAPSRHIEFARVNGGLNDLPWQYNFDSYPSVIFFPARRKADSVIFPEDKDKSLVNLIRFVLRHATYDTRLHLAADVCSKTCIQKNIVRSQARIQQLRRKSARLQLQLHHVSEATAGSRDTASVSEGEVDLRYYANLSADFLKRKLKDIQTNIEGLIRLLSYLQSNEGRELSKRQLASLFPVQSVKSGS